MLKLTRNSAKLTDELVCDVARYVRHVLFTSYVENNCRRRSILKKNHDVTIMTSSGHVTSSGACAIDSP